MPGGRDCDSTGRVVRTVVLTVGFPTGLSVKRRLKGAVILLVLAALGINAVACLHAGAMTAFVDDGDRTASPEDLDVFGKLGVILSGVTIPRPVNTRTPTDVGLEHTTHRYANARGDELEAWHVAGRDEAPDGVPESAPGNQTLVLMFHGYADRKQSLLPLAAAMHAIGPAVLLVDFYGSGGSSGSGTTIGILEAQDVIASVAYARAQWPGRRLVLLGQSMGAAAALRAIAVEGLVVDGLIVEAVFDRMTSTVGNRFRSMGLPASPLAELLVFWGGWHTGTDALAHDPVDYAAAVACPTLLLHGGRDRRVTGAEAQAVFDALIGWKRFVEVPDAVHGGVVWADPQRWRNEVEGLLAEVAR